MAFGRCVGQRPDGLFVNFDIFEWLYRAYFWVYLHQTLHERCLCSSQL